MTAASNARAGISPERQTRIALFAGYGGLLLLMTILGGSAISSLHRIEREEERIRSEYVRRSRALEDLRSNIYVSGTRMREYLLDPEDRFAGTRRAQFAETRRLVEREIGEYESLVTPEAREAFDQLKDETAAYFAALAPVLQWSAQERRTGGYGFMQTELLPRRTAILGLADRVQRICDRELERSSEAAGQMVASVRARLVALLILTFLTGMAVAGISLWRLLRLEGESRARFQEVLTAREELKKLSAELRSAQESERRRISRELHDEVGQVLSAISLSLANVRSAFKTGHSTEAFEQLQVVQEMAERNLGVVRDIALLLRPTMLDDLGLLPALRWLAREAARTTGIITDVVADGFPDDLPEEHRTCIFRIAQEAMRNAARHSGATRIGIYLRQGAHAVLASVQDDGAGFDPAESKGLGILGMEERALHLGGSLRVTSERGRGTVVALELPRPALPAGSAQPAGPMDASCEPSIQVEINPLRTA